MYKQSVWLEPNRFRRSSQMLRAASRFRRKVWASLLLMPVLIPRTYLTFLPRAQTLYQIDTQSCFYIVGSLLRRSSAKQSFKCWKLCKLCNLYVYEDLQKVCRNFRCHLDWFLTTIVQIYGTSEHWRCAENTSNFMAFSFQRINLWSTCRNCQFWKNWLNLKSSSGVSPNHKNKSYVKQSKSYIH